MVPLLLQVDNSPVRSWLIASSIFFVVAAILSLMVSRLRETIAAGRRELLVEIQARRRAEAELRREKDFIGQLMETSPVGILVVDTGGGFTFANPAAARVLGRPREQIVGLSCTSDQWRFTDYQGQPLPARDVPFLRVLGGGGAVRNAAVAVESAAGKRTLLSINVAPLGEDRDKPSGCVATVEDVTERLRLEQEIFRTQKLESVGVLAGGIAHDFNNLLTAIMGNISVALMGLPVGGAIAESLADAEKASLQARDLTQQLLTFSRGGVPVKRTVAVGELVANATQFALRGANIRAVSAIPPDLWAIEADQGQIGQVFHNLAVNACQATPDGGTVRLEAANVVIGCDSPLRLPAGNYVRVTVADSGGGIPAENLPKIFDPFFTTKRGGTGLGLAVVYSVVKSQGGHIAVASEIGTGTTFTIHLPATTAAAPPTAPTAKTSPGRGRILVMDDEAVVRHVVARTLATLGYEVQATAEGASAVAAYRDALAAGRPFDAVLLDLTVPGGMGGAEAMRQLLAVDPYIRGIVSSGYSNDPVMSNFRDHGFCGVIAKPYQAQGLSRVLRQVLDAT